MEFVTKITVAFFINKKISGKNKKKLSEHTQMALNHLPWFVKQKNKCKVFACFFENTY
jgi:hypothetical protein